jgi:hypothetical protein
MRGRLRELEQRLGAWVSVLRSRLDEDRGAVTTETVIITAIVATAAAALATFIATNIGNWQSGIPLPGS